METFHGTKSFQDCWSRALDMFLWTFLIQEGYFTQRGKKVLLVWDAVWAGPSIPAGQKGKCSSVPGEVTQANKHKLMLAWSKTKLHSQIPVVSMRLNTLLSTQTAPLLGIVLTTKRRAALGWAHLQWGGMCPSPCPWSMGWGSRWEKLQWGRGALPAFTSYHTYLCAFVQPARADSNSTKNRPNHSRCTSLLSGCPCHAGKLNGKQHLFHLLSADNGGTLQGFFSLFPVPVLICRTFYSSIGSIILLTVGGICSAAQHNPPLGD